MPGEPWPVLTDLPPGSGWEFGGFPYGLEPLTLPPPADPDLPPEAGALADHAEVLRRVHLALGRGVPGGEAGMRPAPDVLFWFRWITGHQASFVIWRLMAQLIGELMDGQHARGAVVQSLCHYVRGYTAMLLYTGSCPAATYGEVIRPSLRLRHPGFSGSWAPDYWPVKDLLRSRRLPFMRSPESAELRQAVGLMQLVHDGVAAKLVPDGRSLLQESRVRRQDMQLLHLLYDNFFLTLRAPVSRHAVVAQLLRRLVAIARDVAVNDLRAELWISEAEAYERRFGEILALVAASAADGAGERLPAADDRPVTFAGC